MESTATAEKPSVDQVSFAFVQALAADLNRDNIELPSFPDIAMRVKRVLEDENSTSQQVARVIGSEPGLAARVLNMANSAAISRSGAEVLDVKTAVNRLGHDQIRSSAMSYAMKNLMDSRTVAELKPHLTDLWNHSVHVAAVSYSLARRVKGVNPDEAMFVGLIHDIGKLYILTRVENHPELFSSTEALVDIVDGWHTAIGRAILETWTFPDHVLDAVDNHDNEELKRFGEPDLADVLIVANLFSNIQQGAGEVEEGRFDNVASCQRMGIDDQAYKDVLTESREEIAELMRALSG